MENDLISRSALTACVVNTPSKVCQDAPYDHVWFTRLVDREQEILDEIKNAPAVDAVSRAAFEQIKWERDCAMQQLKDHGIPFGGTAPDVVKVLLCAFCAKFDTSGYDNSNEDDFLLHTGYCKHWEKNTQGCGFCDQRERRG